MIATLEFQLLEECLTVQEGGEPYHVFEYLYRDASNYKAFGELWLTGSLSEQERGTLVGSLESGEFFVAEQVGVPPLYGGLYNEFGGRTQDDHAWHAFLSIRAVFNLPPEVTVWGRATDLLEAFVTAQRDWKPQLSPNFDFAAIRPSARRT